MSPDWAELRELLETGSCSEVCEWIAGEVSWENMPRAMENANAYGITEGDVTLWVYLNLK